MTARSTRSPSLRPHHTKIEASEPVSTEVEVDTAPYSLSLQGAMEYSGLSESRLRKLIRADVLAVRYEGAKVLILQSSLRRYVDSLPSVRVVERECAAQRGRGDE